MTTADKQDNIASGLIDVDLLQRFQEQFCKANRIYLVCIGVDDGVLTELYGSDEERAFLHKYVGENAYMSLLMKLSSNTVEHIQEEFFPDKFLKMCGVSTNVGGRTQIIWCAVAIMQEAVTPEDEIPDYMMTTTEENFYRALEFLEYFSKMLFAVKLAMLMAILHAMQCWLVVLATNGM